MGTTADKLNKILETKQAIRQAIITKGVDVGEDTKFADYPSRIAAIQTGSGEGGSDAFYNMRTQNGTNFSNLFYNYSGSELDVSDWDTSQVTDMSMMFAYCSGLTSLDVSNFNTNNVFNMIYMFSGCGNLTALDLSNFDTSKVNSMYSMFEYCNNLQSLDLSSFDTSNVSSMNYMFNNCSNLKELNTSSFNTSNVNEMNSMFAYCYGLKSLDLSHFNTSNVTNIDSMFAWCTNLEELDIRNFNVNNIEYVNCMFEGCSMLHKLRLDNCNYDTINKIINSAGFPTGTVNGEKREIYCTENSSASIEQLPDGWKFVIVEPSEPSEPTPDPVGTYAVNFSTYGSTALTVNNVDVSDQVTEVNRFEDTISYKYETTEPITQVSFKDNTDLVRLFSLDSSNILDMSEMFDGCTNFVGIIGMMETGAALNMKYMFRNCTSLSSIPDSYFTSVANVMDMTGMYYNCSNMTGTVEAYKYWENSMVGSYSGCFHNCTSLDNYSEIPMDWGGPDDSEQ